MLSYSRIYKIYISGPMNGRPGHNLQAFREARIYLNALGWNSQVPPAVDDHSFVDELLAANREPTPAEHAELLRQDLKLLLECEAIALINGWARSKGAMIELNAAIGAGLDVHTVDLEATPIIMTSWC